ncbi:MAG: molybdopterin-dependent oxidoreductase [Pirellulales bacterium]
MLVLDGEVERPLGLTAADLAALPEAWQVRDVSQLDPSRRGRAVRLAGLLEAAGVRPAACYLTLHAWRDDFHASVPLAAVLERAVVIYELAGGPLPVDQGGPFRFLVLDAAACKSAEVDECVSVKYVDRLELSTERRFDNRPTDDRAHAALHAQQSQQQ